MQTLKKASIEYKEERRSRGFIDENKPSTDNEKLNGRVFNIGTDRQIFIDEIKLSTDNEKLNGRVFNIGTDRQIFID